MSSVTETKRQIEVMQAFVDGKSIQFKSYYQVEWLDAPSGFAWDWIDYDYRIAPPKKVEMWQWVIKLASDRNPFITVDLFESEAAVRTAYGPKAIVIQRADWTRIEIEVENGKD